MVFFPILIGIALILAFPEFAPMTTAVTFISLFSQVKIEIALVDGAK